MLLADRLTLDAPRRTADGYLAVRAKAARTGFYAYTGWEIDPNNEHGLRDQATVNVLRDEATVFDKKAVHSFIGKPITDDHPSVAVNADNWRDHARGVVMGAEWQEGGYLAFDLLLTDASAIAAVEGGKRELSNGYAAELVFGDFQAPDGTRCQARQDRVSGNHVAIVDKGRAGPNCRIGDAAACASITSDSIDRWLNDERTYQPDPNGGNSRNERRETSNSDGGRNVATKMITFDGLPVEVTDAAEAVIRKLEGQVQGLTDGKAKAETDVATLTTTVATRDAEIVTLNKQVEDAKVTPQQMRDAAKRYAQIVDQAKALGVAVTDAMDEAAIMKAAVTAKVGDAAKEWTDVQIAASFATLAKDTKPSDPLRDAITGGVRPTVNDSGASVRDLARMAQY